jgi:hypothetical protein
VTAAVLILLAAVVAVGTVPALLIGAGGGAGSRRDTARGLRERSAGRHRAAPWWVPARLIPASARGWER